MHKLFAEFQLKNLIFDSVVAKNNNSHRIYFVVKFEVSYRKRFVEFCKQISEIRKRIFIVLKSQQEENFLNMNMQKKILLIVNIGMINSFCKPKRIIAKGSSQ